MNPLIQKYNVPVPRYTSYPTVPYWESDIFTSTLWKEHVRSAYFSKGKTEGLSLYIHLPFCESLCTYCGCNTRITVNHAVEEPYIDTLLKEWKLYLALFEEPPLIKEIHLGGGTPTFFSVENLEKLIKGIQASARCNDETECSFEAHPNNTTEKHLQSLFSLGFRRLSLGIQDFDPKVQEIIHRKQSVEQVLQVMEAARSIGYTSINFDLIYGLPLQTMESIVTTIQKVVDMHPDRIAFYSYAHVPWLKPGQRKYTERDLPSDENKRALYEKGRALLEKQGYMEIGMDHFALPHDPLLKALDAHKLHRNFMGYTTTNSTMLIGLGCSSISETGTAFAQNSKSVEGYTEKIERGELATFQGHICTEEDIIIRKHILELICHLSTSLDIDFFLKHPSCFWKLEEMEFDGLIDFKCTTIQVTQTGKAFLRNICSALDVRMQGKTNEKQVFSKAV